MELYRCQSKTDFGANEVKLYRVNIDSDNYFEVNSLEIRPGIRIVDIRSLRGNIVIDFDAKDDQLKRLIHEYIRITDNVELINILSREYNEHDWFDAYDESYNSNQAYTKNQLLGIQNNEVATIVATSQIVDIRRFIKVTRDKSGHLKPSALYTYLHEGIPRNQKLDLESLDFIPIWYINGLTNDSKCELFCCFEILIHILAKRFVEFKAKLLQLASTDIQLAKAENQTIVRYQHLTQLQLIREIEKLEAEKKGLKKKNGSLEEQVANIQALLEASTQREKEKDAKIDKLLASNKEQNKLLKKSNQDIDTLHNMLFGVKNTVEDSNRIIRHQDTKIDKLSKAAGFAIHEMKKQTIAKTRVEVNTDILVLFRTALKPVSDDIRSQASETQIWLGSYNGDIEKL